MAKSINKYLPYPETIFNLREFLTRYTGIKCQGRIVRVNTGGIIFAIHVDGMPTSSSSVYPIVTCFIITETFYTSMFKTKLLIRKKKL